MIERIARVMLGYFSDREEDMIDQPIKGVTSHTGIRDNTRIRDNTVDQPQSTLEIE